jgi:hypothetical protein
MQEVLPEGVDVPSSFETVGHIAHFNLRDEQVPYQAIIGQVCLDKNPTIKTVVQKVGEIENEFRVFAMKIIAGVLSKIMSLFNKQPIATCTVVSSEVWDQTLCEWTVRIIDVSRRERYYFSGAKY